MKFLSSVVLTLLAGTLMAQKAPQWKVDKAHTSVNFTATHFFSEVPGSFDEFSGDFYINPDNIKESTMNFTAKVKSVNTKNKKRDKHLMSPDFFNAQKYPTMDFKSTSFEKKGENTYVLYGKLTIKDVTKEVKIPFEVKGLMKHPMKKGVQILGLSFSTTIDRTEFDVGTGDWAATAVVGDDVQVSIDMELNREV